VRRYAVRLAAAALVAAAAGLVVPPPAGAATCGGAGGVSVVVDFHQLGGLESACDAQGGGRTAAQQMTDVGHVLTRVQRQPGFVCRVDGKPKSDPCVDIPPSDAYWSLWWSDGKSGSWTYASVGVDSLKVPSGGYVALSWQGTSGKAPPRVSPTPHAAPSSAPSSHPTSAPPSSPPSSAPPSTTSAVPGTGPTSSGPSAPRSTAKQAHAGHRHPSSSPKADQRRRTASASTSPGPATTQADGALDPAASTSESRGSGLPGWVAPAAVVLVFAAAGTVLVVRRRRSGGA
jgi:hypothetical protein